MSIFFNTVKACVFSTVEYGHKIVSNAKATDYLVDLVNICLKPLGGSEVKKWTAVTRLVPYAHELTSGNAAGSTPGRESRLFFGNYNYPKVLSRLCLVAQSFFHSIQTFFQWGIIAQETAKVLSFGLQGPILKETTFTLGVAGWSSDLVDATSRLYEEGLSLKGGVIFTHDLAMLASITVGRLPFVPQVVKNGVKAIAAVLGILRELLGGVVPPGSGGARGGLLFPTRGNSMDFARQLGFLL